MPASVIREATIPQGEPVAVEELAFMRERLPLLQPGLLRPGDRKRAQDRTVHLAGRWKILSDDLPKIRAQTLTCLEASEGKGGAVVLRIADREKFDSLKESIKTYQEQIATTEDAIRALDEMHAGFLDELHDTRSSLAGAEAQQRQLLSSVATGALLRGSRLRQAPEAVLEQDQIYQAQKGRCEFQIATAKKKLAEVVSEIEKIEAILTAAGV